MDQSWAEAIRDRIVNSTVLKQLMERVLGDVMAVFPAWSLSVDHPMRGMLAEDPVLPTLSTSSGEAPALLLHGLSDLHLRASTDLTPATQRLLSGAVNLPGAVNVLVGATGIGQMLRRVSRWLAAPSFCSLIQCCPAGHWCLCVAGKTRTLFETLSWSFGLYIAAPANISSVDSGSYDMLGLCRALEQEITPKSSPWKRSEAMAHAVTLAFHLMIYVRVVLLQWMAELAEKQRKPFTPHHWLIFQLLMTEEFQMPEHNPMQVAVKFWFAQHQRVMLALCLRWADTELQYVRIQITSVSSSVINTAFKLGQRLFQSLHALIQAPAAAHGWQLKFTIFADEAQALFQWCENCFSSRDTLSPPREGQEMSVNADQLRPLFSMFARCLNSYR